jgi:aconitate hydratase
LSLRRSCKKQGLLPLTFVNPEDYDKVHPTDFVDLVGIESLSEGSKVTLICKHQDGSKDEIPLTHTFNAGQLAWHRAGSALNLMGQTKKGKV